MHESKRDAIPLVVFIIIGIAIIFCFIILSFIISIIFISIISFSSSVFYMFVISSFISVFFNFVFVYLRYTILNVWSYLFFFSSVFAYTKLFATISITMFATSKIDVVRIPLNGWLLPAVTRTSLSTKNGWSMTWMMPFVHSTSGRNTGMFRWFHWME